MIYKEEDLKREIATHRCRVALKEIDVPGYVIDGFKPGRLLDYFVHLCIMERPPMHWTKALQWIEKHKNQILDRERNERLAASSASNGEINN